MKVERTVVCVGEEDIADSGGREDRLLWERRMEQIVKEEKTVVCGRRI